MARCKENSGILFNHPCSEEANGACGRCARPICARHQRMDGNRPICITCGREVVKERRERGERVNGGRYDDDPYFFFYYADWGDSDDPYDDSDYALFDGASQDGYDGTETGWEGS